MPWYIYIYVYTYIRTHMIICIRIYVQICMYTSYTDIIQIRPLLLLMRIHIELLSLLILLLSLIRYQAPSVFPLIYILRIVIEHLLLGVINRRIFTLTNGSDHIGSWLYVAFGHVESCPYRGMSPLYDIYAHRTWRQCNIKY